ncbi:hypothetical protein LVD17_08515 [Fulvivirga ulvae]|uniref:hypothetical protein n=1 Tax=Fulvivirga ulvae TaxID=2904245 RepID=UPI001F2DA0FD|nr:hypothetical protein [Fulvivirga ulvae]UII33856.1 hypothetical protein LVD17_08515 [Fulvivirga ulvae]
MADLDKLMYMWILLIEREVKKELKYNDWEPLNLKLIEGAQKEALYKKVEHQFLSSYFNQYYENKEKAIVLPRNYEGMISLIYNVPCGEVIEGDSSIVVNVPSNGVIGFKYGGCIENDIRVVRVGVPPLLHFYNKKIKEDRELLFVNDFRNETYDDNMWGVYEIDGKEETFSYQEELKSYRRSLLYVGTYEVAIKLRKSKGANDTTEKEFLKKCYDQIS